MNPFTTLWSYRELLLVMTWKNITLRYKQSHLGLAWMVLRPLVLVGVFTVVRGFVGIDSGDLPYVLLTYCAMVPWAFFQEASSEGVGSIVNHANLIKKIYFPREIFPIASLLTKLIDLTVSLLILFAMMIWFGIWPRTSAIWVPAILIYTISAALTVSLAGAAMNVYSRDMSQGMPLLLSLLMYLSPVMYPLELVRKKLIVERAAGEWSDALYTLYILNPLAGAIDAFQRVLLRGLPPDWTAMWPGLAFVVFMLPLSYYWFKRAEVDFADVI